MIEWFSSIPKRRLYVICSLILIIILSGVLYLVFSPVKTETMIKNSTELMFEGEQEKSKIIYSDSTKETWLVVGGKKKQRLSTTPHSVVPLLKLPKTTASVDIASSEPSSSLTWEATLKDSSSFLNYLKSQGYEQVLRVTTSDFIEIYLKQDTTYKRLIVFPNSFMYGSYQNSSKLPKVSDYLEKYKYLGGQLNNE